MGPEREERHDADDVGVRGAVDGGDEDDEGGAERQEQELAAVLAAEQQRRGESERGEDGAEDDGAIVEQRGEAGVGGERGGAEDG